LDGEKRGGAISHRNYSEAFLRRNLIEVGAKEKEGVRKVVGSRRGGEGGRTSVKVAHWEK